MKLSSELSPIVKIFDPAIDTLEKPCPIPLAFQAKGGPPSGHSPKSPLSGEIPSRWGPRHCGQSALAPKPVQLPTRAKDIKTLKQRMRDISGLTQIRAVLFQK